MGSVARSYRDLKVYQEAYALAMRIFEESKRFPKEETYSLTDQVRRSSRSVTANIAEAWAKRRYEASFILKLPNATGEAEETENWIGFAVDCGYLSAEIGSEIQQRYQAVVRTLNAMVLHANTWCERDTGYKPQATGHIKASPSGGRS